MMAGQGPPPNGMTEGHRMNRREFIVGLGGAAVWPLVAQAQQSGRMRPVAVLISYAESDPLAQIWFRAFVDEMQALGWIDGRNVRLDVRWAGGVAADRLQGIAKELIDLQPDVVFAMTTPSVKAVLRASHTVPIVFTQVTDPVAQGLAESLNQPGANVTGITLFENGIGSKLMEVLKEIAPRTTRVAVIFNPNTAPYYKLYMSAIEVAAASFAMKAFEAPAHNRAEIETVISTLAREPAGGVIPIPDIFTVINRDLIIALAARYRLPAMYPFRFFVSDGGLVSYGVDLSDMQRRAAGYVDRILKGAKAADLPVQLPTKYELVINLKTAKALGLDMPHSLLARADEVIE
jgi:putative tryptophan/tyrosine transport system substrate-binding protein